MANKFIYGVDEFSEAQSPVNGDSFDMAYDEAAHHAAANRTHYLNERRKEAVSSSSDDAIASLESFSGDANWHDSSVITKTLSGRTAGDVACLIVSFGAVATFSAGGDVDCRIKVVDTGVTSYVDGMAARIADTSDPGGHRRVCIAGKHTFASASAVFTLQVKNTDVGGSIALWGGWSIVTL